MTAQLSVCRLCYRTVEENEVEVIDESLRGMLQSVLTRIDLTVSENPVICHKCSKKLVANYNFKRKCIFTEDSITPFVVENVKLDLKEIRNQIIKLEDMEDDKNVCRLCLQFVDSDMTLSDSEKEQFQRFFPEINLSRTNFVILCLPCYDFLHKYFIFVTSCLELEQQLCNYSLDQAESKIDTKEEHVGIKLEKFQQFIKNIKEEDEKDVVLNEELDIKCDSEEDDKRCNTNKQDVELSQLAEKKESYFDVFINEIISNQGKVDAKITWYKCEHCDRNFKLKKQLKGHIRNIHTDSPNILRYQCEQCNKNFKHNYHLKKHVATIHTDPSKIIWYQCEQCVKKFKYKQDLRSHNLYMHTDPSAIYWYHCPQCKMKFKEEKKLRYHIKCIHIDPSKLTWHQCEQCGKKFKQRRRLEDHMTIHAVSSEITFYQCEQCNKKFEHKGTLNKHVKVIHSDHSKAIVSM